MENLLSNSYKEHFMAGFCTSSTPISQKMKINGESFNNPFFIKSKEISKKEINFWDDDLMESLFYFSGGIIGLAAIPFDVLFAGALTIKGAMEIVS